MSVHVSREGSSVVITVKTHLGDQRSDLEVVQSNVGGVTTLYDDQDGKVVRYEVQRIDVYVG